MGLYVGQYNSDRKFFHRSADILVLELFQLNSAGRISFSSLRGFKRNKKVCQESFNIKDFRAILLGVFL